MAQSELETMDPGELEHRLVETRRELFNLRFQLATGQLDNTARIGQVRKEIARILTHLHQLAAVDAAGTGGAGMAGGAAGDEEEG